MNKNQISRKEMQEAVATFLDTHAEIWNTIPKIAEFKNKLDELNTQIEETFTAQQNAQVFLGKSKTQLKQVIAQKADMINDVVEAYAALQGDTILEQKMADSASMLYKLRNQDFMFRIKEIIQEADKHLEALKDFGLSGDQISDLKADFDGFLALNGEPRMYRIASSQATQDLDQLFAAASELLVNQLDKVMKIFRTRNANFYNGYLAARTIVG
ncbi:MAG: hypothetical protein NW226_12685 [Microscillaceae bacterium]|nr:hypothetical protein [Microscillaceae bacterium]